MAYLGGKSKGYNHIIKVLNNSKYDNIPYLEPFVGMAHILKRIENKSNYYASDTNPLVYSLLNGIQRKKQYPFISKDRYFELKNQKKNTFEKSLAAFTYSYNGKEFAGYTLNDKDKTRNYPNERIRYYESLKKNPIFMKTILSNIDYKLLNPKGYIIYCDPPYKNTTEYGDNDFNHHEFWDIMRKWSKNNYVFISEYIAPKDFKVIGKINKFSSMSGKGSNDIRIEKLFQYNKKNHN